MKCKQCSQDFDYSPIWYAPVRSELQKKIDEYHLNYCVDCLRKDDNYIDLCSRYFQQTGIDVCRF